jgi:hypothetical protein
VEAEFQELYVFLEELEAYNLLIYLLSSFYKTSPSAVQECEVAVRSRTEALADWYKAGEQLVQRPNPRLSTKFVCPNCPTVAVLERA